MEDFLLGTGEKQENLDFLSMPIGYENFELLRKNKYYYIDKTRLLPKLLKNSSMVTLFTRPRRFGKTLTMSMLEYFLSIEKKEVAPSLFSGLQIMKDKEVCDTWMNKYPVIFLSLKDIDGDSFEDAYRKLVAIIADIASKFAKELRDRSQFESLPKALADSLYILENGVATTPMKGDIASSLKNFCQVSHFLYRERAILLIDEYDVPLAKAEEHGYYSDMITIIRGIFSAALKGNNYIKQAIIPGCLRISKESIFTGLNNLDVYDISRTGFADLFGFTPTEVNKLLSDTNFSHMENTIRKWYDGYRFGRKQQEIFCPWDVIKYIKELQEDDSIDLATTPPSYWKNSSENEILFQIEKEGGYLDASRVEDLLAGKCISVELDEQVTYKNLYTFTRSWKSEEIKNRRNILWTVLYMTGYLTLASPEKIQECGITPKPRETLLVIPNREIREIFEGIVESLKESAKANSRQGFVHALWEGNDKDAQDFLSEILLYDVGIRKKGSEDYYQGLLQGLFIGDGYKTITELESGDGYCDLAVFKGDKGIIIETKWAAKGDKEKLQKLVEEGILQSKNRNYGVDIMKPIQFRYSIAIIGKHCLVKKVENIYKASDHKKDFLQS